MNTLHHTVTKNFIGNGLMKEAVETMNSSELELSQNDAIQATAVTGSMSFNRKKVIEESIQLFSGR